MTIRISTRTRIISAAAIVLTAGVATTFAAFSDSGAVQTTLASGTLDLKFDDAQDGNPQAYHVDFSTGADRMVPGDSVTRDLVVYNSGSIDANLDLAVPTIVNSEGSPVEALEQVMVLTVTDGATTLYQGPLAGATFADLPIGADGPDTSTTLHLTATLPAHATLAVAGQALDITLPFTAEQD